MGGTEIILHRYITNINLACMKDFCCIDIVSCLIVLPKILTFFALQAFSEVELDNCVGRCYAIVTQGPAGLGSTSKYRPH